MSLSAGHRFGPYEILAPIGAGGMGEVYRARDPRLGRDVALKVLPEVFARDSERMARFEREAQVLASLNHPSIAAIYGLEESEGTRAIVMELVEGPTLRGPLPLRRGAATRAADRRGSRVCPRARNHPQGPQAGQRKNHTRRQGEGARFRPRESSRDFRARQQQGLTNPHG